jgi:hypothetical protein
MDNSLWQDEAELANMFLEDETNRSSSESNSAGFHFNSTANLKKNLAATFDMELPARLPVLDLVDRFEPNNKRAATAVCATTTTRSEDQSSRTRPPLPTGFAISSKPRKSKKKFAVYLRIRPLSPHSPNDDSCAEKKGASTIEILKSSSDSANQTLFPTAIRTYPPTLSNAYKMNINRQSRENSAYAKEFNFDRVMGPETSQENVYSTVAAPLIQDLLAPPEAPTSSSRIRNKSALLFSYGITNAGKTHTVLGDMKSTNQANWGIIPRAISEIFQQNRIHSVSDDSATASKPPCNLYISFFEVYKENVFDLMPSNKLSSSKNVNISPEALRVRECRGQIFVRGLTKHKISNIAQGIELTKQAHKKRHTSSNNLNSDSSRSHFVCQIQIVPLTQQAGSFSDREFTAEAKVDKKFPSEDSISGYSTDEEATVRSRVRSSTLWIVDLAGSERSKRTRVGSTRQKESTKINNSLMTLMRCLNAMRMDGKKVSKNVIPFRESKLTHIFMGHLTSESAARTAMMVNVNPSVEDFDETQHVLAYSRKAKLIEINIKEYGMKRKEFVSGEAYDHNGRKKPRLGENKYPKGDIVSNKPKGTLLSRLAKKLSPKRVTERKPAPTEIEKGHNEEIVRLLKKSLQVTKEKVSILEDQNLQLLEELDNKEDQIRIEVSMEMEKRLRETRTKHNEKYEQLKSVMRQQASKADVSVSMNRAGIQLEELMDKIDECEKETLRMSHEHQQIVVTLNNQIEELNRKEIIAAEEKVRDTLKISSLEEALKRSNDEIMRLEDDVQEAGRREPDTKIAPKDINIVQSTEFKRNLRPRKPLGNSTNQTAGSQVF